MSSLESVQAWASAVVSSARAEMASPPSGGVRSWQVGVPGALSLELRLWPSVGPEEGWSVSVHADGARVDGAAGGVSTVEEVLSSFGPSHAREFWEAALRFQSSLAAAGVDVVAMAGEALVRDVMEG